jgi:hypothetical protein
MADLTKRAMRVVSEEEDGMLLKTPLDQASKFSGKAGLNLAEYDLGDPRFQSLKEWGPDVAVMLAVLWCWGSWYSSSVEWLQLVILTSASVVSFGRVYFIRTLKGQLDHFKDENQQFKVSNSDLKDVVSSLRAKNDHFKSANQDLQCSIAGLEHVREVIETHAAKTNGDFSNILGELQRSVTEQKRIQRNTQQIQERIRNLCEIQSQTMMMNLFSTCQLSDPERGMNREEFDIFMSMLPSSVADRLEGKDGKFTFESVDIHHEGVITGARMRDWVQDITDQILENDDAMVEAPAPRAAAGSNRKVLPTIKSNSPTRGGGFCGLWNASRGISTDSPYQPVSCGEWQPNSRGKPDSRGASPSPFGRSSPDPASSPGFCAPPAGAAAGARATAPVRGGPTCQSVLYTPGEGITQAPRRSSPGRRGSGSGSGGGGGSSILPVSGGAGEAFSPAPGSASTLASPQAQFLQRQASKAALAGSPGYSPSDAGGMVQSRPDCGKWPLQSDDRHPSCSGSTSTAFDCSLNGTLSTTFDSPNQVVPSSFIRAMRSQ